MSITFPNSKDDFEKDMPTMIDERPAWLKNHNSKNDKVLNRDPKKLEVLNQIDIDLPSVEDIKALWAAREQEIRKTCANEENYIFHKGTDFASVTGRQRYDSDTCYLSTTYEDKVSYYKDGDFHNDDDTIRYSRKCIIRPVLKFDRCPELFSALLSARGINQNGDDKYARILLGWMPRYAESKTDQEKINQALKEKAITKTSDVYTIDGTYIHNEKNTKKDFKPLEYPVYESWNGTRFIHFKVFQNYGNKDLLDRLTIYKSDAIALRNGQTYFNGDMVWFLVSQIPWIVDIERKCLIAQEGLLCGIQFDNYDVNRPRTIWEFDKIIDYQESNVKWFLETHMKYEMLANESLLFNKAKVVTPTKPINDSKTSEITDILNKIKTYKKFYYGDIDINTKVHNLINDYNKRLDEIANNIGHETNSLSIEISNPKLLYQKLILNLNDILSELITHGEKVKNYHDMIEILEECQKDEIDTSKDEICMTINTIKNVILEFIRNKEVRDNIKRSLDEKIITVNINRNKSYIEEFKTNPDVTVRSLDELKLEFKRDLHPYLENLSDVIKKQDLVNEIMGSLKKMIDNNFTESKNTLVNNYLSILNEIVTRINLNGTEKDINSLKSMVNLDNDDKVVVFFDISLKYSDDINDIVQALESLIISAYKIDLDIQERNNIKKEIDDLKVTDDVPSFFEEEKTK